MTKASPPPQTYAMRSDAADYPMMLVLSFVFPCNAKCPHCPYTNSDIRKEYADMPFMPAETFRKIADESGPHGAFLRISGGGEPMLHPEAVELFLYAKARGCRVGLITNGSKFDADNSRALIEAGIDMIEFSVDASTAEGYAVARAGLEWDTLLTNVRRMIQLRKAGNSTTKIVASAVHQAGVDIDEVERFWVEDIGVDYVIKRKFLTWGINTNLDGARSGDPGAYLDTEVEPCPFLFERLNIDTRGNIMVCGYDISANTEMGNCNSQNISEIWHGPGFEWYRGMHLKGKGKDIPLCAGCPDWQYRSWHHNYWKVVANAEEARQRKLTGVPARLEEQ